MPVDLSDLGAQPVTTGKLDLSDLGAQPIDPLKRKITRAEDLPKPEEFDASHQAAVGQLRTALTPGPSMRAAEPPGLIERAKEFFLGGPRTGDTPLGRALGRSYEAPSEQHTPTTELPLVRPTAAMQEAPTSVASGVGKGALEFAEGMTTAPNVLLAAGSGGLGLLGKVHSLLPRAVSATFSAQMLKSAYDQFPEVKKAWDAGNAAETARALTKAIAEAGMGVLAGKHAIGERRASSTPAPAETPTPEESPAQSQEAPVEGPRISGPQYLRAKGEPAGSPAAESAKVFEAAGPTYTELFDQLEQRDRDRTARDRRPPKASIPEEGVPENVERAVDARNRISVSLTGVPFNKLNNPDRLAIDDLIRQGFGFAVQPEAKPAVSGGRGEPAPTTERTGTKPQPGETEPPLEETKPTPTETPKIDLSDLGARPAEAAQPEKSTHSQVDKEVDKAASPEIPPGVKPRPAGRETAIAVPGTETRYPARYTIRELSELQASHNAHSFEPNPNYAYTNDRDYSQAGNAARVVEQSQKFDPSFLTTDSPTAEHGTPIVDANGNTLSGNSRTMTLARVYKEAGQGAAKYRQQLAEKAASFGLDPAELQRFKEPVLVREVPGGIEAQKAITDFNKASAAELSPEERAVSDGRRLSTETVQDIGARLGDLGESGTMAEALRGDDGATLINRLVKDGVVTEQEKNGWIDERGHLTAEAKGRISKALVGRLFRTPTEFRETPPAMRQKLERVAPQVLRVEGRPEWSLTDRVREAVGLVEDARAHKMTVEETARQAVLGAERRYSPEAIQLAETLSESPRNVEYAFRRYANDEALSREGAQQAFFEPPSRQQAFQDAFGEISTQGSRVPKLDLRNEPYFKGIDTPEHIRATELAPIKLENREQEFADAYATNLSGMELIGRATGRDWDTVGPTHAGIHIGSADVQKMANNLHIVLRHYFPDGAPPAAEELKQAFARAAQSGKSVVLIADHKAFEQYHDTALTEELHHSMQSRLGGGSVRRHLGTQLDNFMAHPSFERAATALFGRGYEPSAKNTTGVEVGVRLMRPEGYKELNLRPTEARSLGAAYVRALRAHYGTKSARGVANEVFSALRPYRKLRPGEESAHRRGPEEPGTEPPSTGPPRGKGPAGGDGPDLSGYRPGSAGPQARADRGAGEQLRDHRTEADSEQKQAPKVELSRLVEVMSQAQQLRTAGLKFFEWSKRMRDRFPELSTAQLASLFSKSERGSISVDPGAVREAIRNSPIGAGVDMGKALAESARSLGSRIAREGEGAGEQLMRIIRRAGDVGDVHAGKLLARWADVEPSKLNREQRAELLDALEGRTKARDPEVKRVFETARGITDEMAGTATGLGLEIRTARGKRPFAALDNYFPHVFRSPDQLSRGPVRRDVIANLVRRGVRKDTAGAAKFLDDWIQYRKTGQARESLLDYMVETRQAKDQASALAKLQRFRSGIDRQGNLEYAREVNLPFYDPDPVRVIPEVAASGAKRLAQVAEFGQDHQRINEEILKIARAGGNIDFVRKGVDRIIGVTKETDTAAEKLSRLARSIETFKLMTAAIPNATQSLNTLWATDFPSLAAGMGRAFTKSGRRFALESGAAIEPVLNEAHKELGGGQLANRFLKGTGFTYTERFNRATAANTGAAWANRQLAKLRKSPDSKLARKNLEDLGIDPDRAIARGKLTSDELLMAAKKLSDYTQFRTRPEDLPNLFTETPLGKAMAQFKNFGYQQARFFRDQVKRDLTEGSKSERVGRGLRGLFIAGVLFPAAGDLVRTLRDKINGRDREFDDNMKRYIDDFMQSSALGILNDALQSSETGHALEFAAGPAAGDAAQLINILAKSEEDETPEERFERTAEALKKYAIKRFGGPLRRVLDDEE